MDKEHVKSEIAKLIDKYNREKSKRYNEEATKNDFILPLFKILGWNVEDSNEVSKEENISGKRVDYGFRIDGIPKFFLEAKSLDEDLEGSRMVKGRQVTYAEQAINYAYYKGCNWAILTNFKGIIVYDAWAKSSQSSFRFAIWVDSLLSDFESVYLLSREAFEQGLLDKKYSTKSRKRLITEQLLLDFTTFRAILSKDVYNLNKSKNLTEEELDEAIQRLFDRLIFIRNCEDRELEPYDLLSVLRQWKENRKGTLVSRLRELFTYFDDTYNSKIFSKHLCDQVDISDDVLSRILDGLYTTEDGSILYDFSLIDADILGNIYEQYLGHILKKTEKRTKLTESRAKRKEEGIYYTPSYIVDYIVRNTVGEVVKNKKVDVSKIKVLDPACGSGSFLIKTFDVLNEYYSKKEGYNQNKLDMSGTGTTYSTKLSILKDNIFGVDLDKQAVDIAQLNLLLKIAEKKRRLPILQQNIKNGNSLIDDPNLAGDKAFKWNEEFAEIMNNGGFDVVIGNPPYFKIFENDSINKTEDYKEIKSGMMNASAVFINRSLKLIKNGGYLGMIVPKMLSFTDSWDKIRHKILSEYKILYVIDCGKAFKGVLLEQIIFILKKEKPSNNDKITIGELDNHIIKETAKVLQKNCSLENRIPLEPNPIAYEIKSRMEVANIRLGDIADITLGLGIQGKDFFFDEPRKGSEKVLRGDDIQRYAICGCRFYDPNSKEIQEYKKTIDRFKTPHIVAQRIVAHIQDHIKITAAFDEEGLFSFNTVTNIFVNDKTYSNEFILALLNSNVVQYYTYKFIYSNAIRSMDFYKAYARIIPLPKPNFPAQEKVSKLARKLISNIHIYSKSKEKQTDSVNELNRDIQKIQTEINEVIYDMYHITEEEKKVIEESIVSKK